MEPFVETLYVGPLALLLAAWGLLGASGRPLRRRAALVLGVAAGVAALLALGEHTPVHGLLSDAFPPLGRLRYPEKFLLLPTLVVCVLAGRGLTLAQRRPPPWWIPTVVGVFPAARVSPPTRSRICEEPSILIIGE